MNGPPQARVLFATLSECTSGRGTTYLRGWAGASTWWHSAARTMSRAGRPGSCFSSSGNGVMPAPQSSPWAGMRRPDDGQTQRREARLGVKSSRCLNDFINPID